MMQAVKINLTAGMFGEAEKTLVTHAGFSSAVFRCGGRGCGVWLNHELGCLGLLAFVF